MISLIVSNHPPSILPVDLLDELHKIEPTGARTAVLSCFDYKARFKREVFVQAIQPILEMRTVLDLFMRPVHLARTFHFHIGKCINETVMIIDENTSSVNRSAHLGCA